MRGVYHCAIYDVPFDLKIQAIATSLVPDPQSPPVRALAKLGCRVVPRALHIYKEPLHRKFGFVILHLTAEDASMQPAEVAGTVSLLERTTDTASWPHNLMKRWIADDLATQLGEHQCRVQLCQPPDCRDGDLFLQLLRQHCTLLSADTVDDIKKMETFILGKVHINVAGGESAAQTAESAECAVSCPDAHAQHTAGTQAGGEVGADDAGRSSCNGSGQASSTRCMMSGGVADSSKVIGYVKMSEFSTQELMFVKKNVKSGFPPVLVSSESAQPHFDDDGVTVFFRRSLSPFFTVQP